MFVVPYGHRPNIQSVSVYGVYVLFILYFRIRECQSFVYKEIDTQYIVYSKSVITVVNDRPMYHMYHIYHTGALYQDALDA